MEVVSDYNKQLILLSVIKLSGEHYESVCLMYIEIQSFAEC